MATSRAEEYKNRLKRWQEEYAAGPKKTEITKGDIKQLERMIRRLEEAERDVKFCEDTIDDFLRME